MYFEEEYVSNETALKLEQLGFPLEYYDSDEDEFDFFTRIDLPTYYQVHRWFREKKRINFTINLSKHNVYAAFLIIDHIIDTESIRLGVFNSYETALKNCVAKAIEYIEDFSETVCKRINTEI